MGMLGYFRRGLFLFKENPAIIILAVLLTVLNVVVVLLQGFFNNVLLHVVSFSPLVVLVLLYFIFLLLAGIFIRAAVVGLTRKSVLNEIFTLKTGWKIGKKYFLKVLTLNITIGAIMFFLMFFIGFILALIVSLLHDSNMPLEIIFMGFIGSIMIIVSFLTLFAVQAVVIGEKGIIDAIKQSISLVLNNKIKTIILIIPMLLNIFLSFIPVVGQVLSGFIGSFIGVYILIVISLVYMDLTQGEPWKTW
jgi:hypothetical protein